MFFQWYRRRQLRRVFGPLPRGGEQEVINRRLAEMETDVKLEQAYAQAFIRNGFSGVIAPFSPDTYIASLFRKEERLERARKTARRAGFSA